MDYITTIQTADILGVSVRRVQQLIQFGRLPAIKAGRDYLLNTQDVEAFAKKPRKPGRPGWITKTD